MRAFRLFAIAATLCVACTDDSNDRCVPTDEAPYPFLPAARIPLDLFPYARTLHEADADPSVACDVVPADVDRESPTFYQDYRGTRTEGCGLVTFATLRWPRTRIYDTSTGALVGAFQGDDVIQPFPGTSCSAAGFVGGLYPPPACEDDVVVYCRAVPSP